MVIMIVITLEVEIDLHDLPDSVHGLHSLRILGVRVHAFT